MFDLPIVVVKGRTSTLDLELPDPYRPPAGYHWHEDVRGNGRRRPANHEKMVEIAAGNHDESARDDEIAVRQIKME